MYTELSMWKVQRLNQLGMPISMGMAQPFFLPSLAGNFDYGLTLIQTPNFLCAWPNI